MKPDERQLEMWDQAWEAWSDLERHYRVGRAWSSRNVWALITLGLGVWEVAFGAWIWHSPEDQWAPLIAHSLGLFVLAVCYRFTWQCQEYLDYLRFKRSQ